MSNIIDPSNNTLPTYSHISNQHLQRHILQKMQQQNNKLVTSINDIVEKKSDKDLEDSRDSDSLTSSESSVFSEDLKNAEQDKKDITPIYRSNFEQLDNITIPNGIVGLSNLGNTCYMNSVLQCLNGVTYFRDYIINSDIIKDLYKNVSSVVKDVDKKNYSLILANSQLTITFQMYKLLNAIWLNQTKSIRPISFKNIFGNKIKNFQNFEQQDAQEALICILNTIHEELQTVVDIDYKIFTQEYLNLFDKAEQENITNIECCKLEYKYPDFWELFSLKRAIDKYNKKSNSCVSNIFQNMISSTLECPECNFHTYSFDPSFVLSIPIPNERKINIGKIKEQLETIKHLPEDKIEQIKKHLIMSQCDTQIFRLEECFNNFINTEILDDKNKWFCPHCNMKVNASKKFSIWIPSKIMIIQLKRFIHNTTSTGYSAHKLNNKIEYPVNDFNITPYISNCSKRVNNSNFVYDLISVINHVGNINGGHFYSFVKSITDNNWYCADDDNITKINNDVIVSANAYLLFYKQREM